MIEPGAVEEIFAVYQKYGWILRRVLLSPELKNRLNLADKEPVNKTGDAVIVDSDLDAAWFSRPPKAGGVAWEIRHLNSVPYAILEQIDEFSEGFEDSLAEVEARLRVTKATTKSLTKLQGHPQT